MIKIMEALTLSTHDTHSLPLHRNLNIGALARLFSERATSYKYLFFISLIDEIIQHPKNCYAHPLPLEHEPLSTNDYLRINLTDIIISLLQFGWYPHRFFKLNFGASDRVGKALDQLIFSINEQTITHPNTIQSLRLAIHEQFQRIGAEQFKRFVPYRILTPFFAQQLKGIPDHQKNKRIVELAAESFLTSDSAFYYFENNAQTLVIHPTWQEYFTVNYAIIRGWALLMWARYLQARNPNVPSILDKIEPPAKRSSLSQQRLYWSNILCHSSLYCIYSGKRLNPKTFTLDHFLPWSFICHDELWNLIPADPVANSAKGRALPSDKNFCDFIVQQHEGLSIYKKIHGNNKSWNRVARTFVEGLSISENELLDYSKLLVAYENKLNPLISLARTMGY